MAWELGGIIVYLGAAIIFGYFSVNTRNPENKHLGGFLFVLSLLGVLMAVFSAQFIAGASETSRNASFSYSNFSVNESFFNASGSFNGSWVKQIPLLVSENATSTETAAGVDETRALAEGFGQIYMVVIFLVLLWFGANLLNEYVAKGHKPG